MGTIMTGTEGFISAQNKNPKFGGLRVGLRAIKNCVICLVFNTNESLGFFWFWAGCLGVLAKKRIPQNKLPDDSLRSSTSSALFGSTPPVPKGGYRRSPLG